MGRRLAAARQRAGLTQRALAFPGCSPGYIARIEAGDRVPSLQLIRELARRLEVTESFLATGRAPEPSFESEFVRAEAALRLGHLDAAGEELERLVDAAASAPDRARALGGLGRVTYARGEPRGAIDLLEEARALAPEAVKAAAADALGRAYSDVGEHEQAIALFSQQLACAEKGEDALEILRFSVLLANAYIDNSEFERATTLLAATIEGYGAECEPLTQAQLLWSQSRLHALRGNPEAATSYARRALAAIEVTDNSYYRALAFRLLAFVEIDAGEAGAALEHVQAGKALLAEGGIDGGEQTRFDLEEARALVGLGRLEEGASLALGAAGALRDGHPLDLGRSFAEAARAFDEAGDTAHARELYELAAQILDQQPSRYLAEVSLRLGDLLEREGDADAAFAAYKRAAGLRAELEARSPLRFETGRESP